MQDASVVVVVVVVGASSAATRWHVVVGAVSGSCLSGFCTTAVTLPKTALACGIGSIPWGWHTAWSLFKCSNLRNMR